MKYSTLHSGILPMCSVLQFSPTMGFNAHYCCGVYHDVGRTSWRNSRVKQNPERFSGWLLSHYVRQSAPVE